MFERSKDWGRWGYGIENELMPGLDQPLVFNVEIERPSGLLLFLLSCIFVVNCEEDSNRPGHC